MKSVRLDDELEDRLQQAARLTGQPVSQIIRDAVRTRCSELLSGNLDTELADVIGSVEVGGNARKTGKAFTQLLRRRGQRRK